MEGGFVNKAAITIKDVAREARSPWPRSTGMKMSPNRSASLCWRWPHGCVTPAPPRSLSSRRTNTVGVVLPDLYGEFSELMRGIDGVARNRRQHLLVSSYHGDQEQQGAAPAMRGRVDGWCSRPMPRARAS